MVFEAIGVLTAAVVQGLFVNEYRKAGKCKEDNEITPELLDKQKWSYTEGAILVVSVCALCAVVCFLGTKERKDVVQSKKGNFGRGLRSVLTFGPYVKLSMSFLFLSLAIAIVQGNLALFCTHALDMGDEFSTFIIILLVSSIGSMPVWQLILKRVGKKTAFAAGMILFIPILFTQLYIGSSDYIFIPILILAGFSTAVALLLPWSMLPDVLDEYMLTTGERNDAIFYSFYVFFSKLAIGLGVGLSQIALELGGYKSGACNQPASVGLALRMLLVPGPVIFVLIALLFLWSYPIDETRRAYNKERLEKLRRKMEGTVDERIVLPPDEYHIDTSLSYESLPVSTSTEL